MNASTPPNSLRSRFCHAAHCGARFFVCKPCDRGQRYCSESCRDEARRKQRREASSRNQRSESGQIKHLIRQRTYRHRHSNSSVTHQGCLDSISTIQHIASSTPKCAFCQLETHWIGFVRAHFGTSKEKTSEIIGRRKSNKIRFCKIGNTHRALRRFLSSFGYSSA